MLSSLLSRLIESDLLRGRCYDNARRVSGVNCYMLMVVHSLPACSVLPLKRLCSFSRTETAVPNPKFGLYIAYIFIYIPTLHSPNRPSHLSNRKKNKSQRARHILSYHIIQIPITRSVATEDLTSVEPAPLLPDDNSCFPMISESSRSRSRGVGRDLQ